MNKELMSQAQTAAGTWRPIGKPAEAAAPAGGGGAVGAVSSNTICSVNFTACRGDRHTPKSSDYIFMVQRWDLHRKV